MIYKLKQGQKVKFKYGCYDEKGNNYDAVFEDEVIFTDGCLKLRIYSNTSIERLINDGLIYDLTIISQQTKISAEL